MTKEKMTKNVLNLLKLRNRAEGEISDLPALMIEAERAVRSVLHGEHAQRKSGAGEKFWQYREYAQGDPLQRIDWRQSAKTDRIYIRQKEHQTTQTAVLWCAKHAGMDFKSKGMALSKIDSARIISMSLALLITNAGDQVGLLGRKQFGRNEKTLELIGSMLCNSEKNTSALPPSDQPLPRHASLIMAGDFLEPIDEIKAALKPLSGQCDSGVIVQVLDPAEMDLPYDGRMIFESPDKSNRSVVNHVGSIREAYQARINAHMAELESFAKQCGWHYVLHATHRPISETLSTIWEQMGRGA